MVVSFRVALSLAFVAVAFWGWGIEVVSAQTPAGYEEIPPISVQGSSASPGRPDLEPDNVANFARVAPSSRPHIETFTREAIDDIKPSDVYDLLNHATGLFTQEQGRKLGFTVMMRGDSNYGFIIDGSYVPIETAGRLLQTMPVSEIEQIDIVRDSTALMLGPLVNVNSASGALNSGFIVVRTHTPSKTEAELRGSFESYGTLTSSGYAGSVSSGGLNSPRAFMSGLISQSRTDGPSGYNTWANSTSGFLKFGLTTGILEQNFGIFVDNARFGFERTLPTQVSAAYADQHWSYAPINSTLLTSNSTFRWDTNNTTLFSNSYNFVNAQNVQGSYSDPGILSLNEDRTYSFNSNLRHSFQFDHTLLQAGAEFFYYFTPTGELFHAGYADKEETLSAYVNVEQKFLDDRLIIDASARADDHAILEGVDIYNKGDGPTYTLPSATETTTTTVAGTPVTVIDSSNLTTTTTGSGATVTSGTETTTTTGSSQTTVSGDTTTVVTPITMTTTTITKPASGPGSGTGTGGGNGGGNPSQFYTTTVVAVTTYQITTTTNGVSTTTTSPVTTTTKSVTAPTQDFNPANPKTTTTTTTTGGTPPISSPGTPATGTTTTTAPSSTYQYFYNRHLPVAKSFSAGAAYKILPQLLATARFSHTEQGGLANVISATGTPLDPENQNKWEVGLVAPITPAFQPGFNLFDIKIDNDKVPTTYEAINGILTPLWAETNTGRFGFELLGEGIIATNEQFGQTSYKASWMHMMSVTSSTIPIYPATISHDVVNGTLTQKWHEYSGTLTLTYVAPYYSDFNSIDNGYHAVGNYVVVDLRLGRTFDLLGTQAKFSIYGRNITDRKYETVLGFPSLGTVYGSELAFTF